MGVSLLAYAVRFPKLRQGLNDLKRLSTLLNRYTLNKICIGAQIAAYLGTLPLMCLLENKLSQRQGVCQTLHDRIEKAGVSVILHGVCYPPTT